MRKTVSLPKVVWHQVFAALPMESRVVDTGYPVTNFWLYDDQQNVLMFTIQTDASAETHQESQHAQEA